MTLRSPDLANWQRSAMQSIGVVKLHDEYEIGDTWQFGGDATVWKITKKEPLGEDWNYSVEKV